MDILMSQPVLHEEKLFPQMAVAIGVLTSRVKSPHKDWRKTYLSMLRVYAGMLQVFFLCPNIFSNHQTSKSKLAGGCTEETMKTTRVW